MLRLAFSLFLLIASPAFCAPKVGPEMEFRGVKHAGAVACAVTVYPKHARTISRAGLGLSALAFGGAAGASKITAGADEENKPFSEETASRIQNAGVGLAATTVAIGFGCPRIRARSNRAYDEKLEAKLIALCADGHCTLSKELGRVAGDRKNFPTFVLTYPDAFQVKFTHDPAAFEIKTSPIPAPELAGRRRIFEEDVFKPLREIGVTPPRTDGPWNGGHIHWDLNDTFADARHFRNFLVDLYNQRELSQGLLADDPIEGAHPFDFDRGARFKKGIAALDAALATNEALSIKELATSRLGVDLADYLDKFTGIHFNYLLGTLEMRSLRAPKSFGDFEKVVRLMSGRVGFVGKQPGLTSIARLEAGRPSRQARLEAFGKYVAESGQSLEEMLSLVPGKSLMRFNDASSRCFLQFSRLGRN